MQLPGGGLHHLGSEHRVVENRPLGQHGDTARSHPTTPTSPIRTPSHVTRDTTGNTCPFAGSSDGAELARCRFRLDRGLAWLAGSVGVSASGAVGRSPGVHSQRRGDLGDDLIHEVLN
jgi:hypothetical protein